MRSHRGKLAGFIATALGLAMWLVFAPTAVGGSATYSITDGISMNPLLYKNDLAVIRAESSYHVGDVVLYQSQVLHKPVLHRILLVQNGNYFFKGDNNGFVDPGYATRSELVGKLWFHIPHAGAVLGWFGAPFHAALLAGMAALVVVLSGSKTTKRRRRRRGASPSRPWRLPKPMIRERVARRSPRPTTGERRSTTTSGSGAPRSPDQERRSGIAMTPQQAAARRAPSYFEGPTLTLTALGVLVLFVVLFLGVGFSRPLQRLAPLSGAFHQTGTFSYTAAAKGPTPVYPTGQLTTGQPIYPSLVDTVSLRFEYHFASPIAHHITGTVELKELLLSESNTWQTLAVLKPAATFTGDGTAIVSTLPLKGLYDLINNVSTQSGSPGTNYTADIQPVVHINGTVGNTSIDETFSPVLPFNVAPAAITLDVAVAPAPPGATYVAPSASTALAATLNPTQAGSVPHLFPNVISVAKYKIRVSLLRTSGLVFVVLALLVALLHEVLRRRRTMRSDEELIAKRCGSIIVPVALLADPERLDRLDVPDFAHLAGLAQYLERPILYEMKDGKRRYAVDDDSRRYFYQPAQEAGQPSDVDGPAGRAAEEGGVWTQSDRLAYRAREAEADATAL